jgi:hypothetical protein
MSSINYLYKKHKNLNQFSNIKNYIYIRDQSKDTMTINKIE